jgi:hypothetical protein
MRVDEIAADVFRLSLYVPEMNIQFNQFFVRNEEPLLFIPACAISFLECAKLCRELSIPRPYVGSASATSKRMMWRLK